MPWQGPPVGPCLAVAMIVPAPRALAAAIAVRPILPAPSTSTDSPGISGPRRNPWMDTAKGSTRAASSHVSESASG